jgi:LmbE family N-acetylglucosaminyl deacetylase
MLRFMAWLRRHSQGHDRIFRFLQQLAAEEQAARLLEAGAGGVLVLAPHMDDEALGCGGALAAHAAAGAEIVAVYLTDGRYGAGPGTAAQPEVSRARRAEAQRAAAVLGIRHQVFIDGLGNRLEQDGDAAAQVRAVLRERRPGVVYLPAFAERHPDHRAAGDLLEVAVKGGDFDFECRAYEVWTPLVPNGVLPIDAVLDRKRAAVDCYESQLSHSDFGHFVLALNAYRSSLVPGGGARYAEAFYCAPLARYLQTHRAFRAACAPT